MVEEDAHGQCDGCGYTLKDAILHGDHYLCRPDPPWERFFVDQGSPEFRAAYKCAVDDAPWGWECPVGKVSCEEHEVEMDLGFCPVCRAEEARAECENEDSGPW